MFPILFCRELTCFSLRFSSAASSLVSHLLPLRSQSEPSHLTSITRDHRTQHWFTEWLAQHDHSGPVQSLRKAVTQQLADGNETAATDAVRGCCVLFGYQGVRPTTAEVELMLAAVERANPARASPK